MRNQANAGLAIVINGIQMVEAFLGGDTVDGIIDALRTVAAIAGGRATLQAVGPNGEDGHNLATSADGPAVWGPLIENFLRPLR